ncbi:Protein Furry-like-Like [Manis pentadactyla]|nr:Protein Furry-like-Like [Manis pentadactyla]
MAATTAGSRLFPPAAAGNIRSGEERERGAPPPPSQGLLVNSGNTRRSFRVFSNPEPGAWITFIPSKKKTHGKGKRRWLKMRIPQNGCLLLERQLAGDWSDTSGSKLSPPITPKTCWSLCQPSHPGLNSSLRYHLLTPSCQLLPCHQALSPPCFCSG